MNDAEVLDGDVRFCLVLPREALSVPVMRRVLGGTLLGFGADEDCVADLLLAASEACTNVLRHGGRSAEYEVSASVYRNACLLEITNGPLPARGRAARRGGPQARGTGAQAGRGRAGAEARLDSVPPRRAPAAASPAAGEPDEDLSRLSESGRGLTIMRACVDDLTLRGMPGRGTVVSMRKQITWAAAVSGRHADGPDGPRSAAGLREAG